MEQSAHVLVVANRTADSDSDTLLDRIRGAGLQVEGMVGDPDPVAAVQDALNAGKNFDEAIVATLPRHLSRWLKLDLPNRVRRSTGVAVTHIEAQGGSATSRD